MSVQLAGATRSDPVVAGVRFALYRAEPGGPGRHPPAVLLHGVPETAHMWRQMLPDLARDRLVLAPDLKGLGESEARAPYDIPTLAGELAALTAAETAGPVDVIGHDWGGSLAGAMATGHPELVRRLVVLNAPQRHVNYAHAWHMVLFSIPGLPDAMLRLGGARAVELMLHGAWRSDPPPAPEVVQHYAAAYAAPERVEAMLAYYRAATRPRLLRAARRLAQPVLPTRGQRQGQNRTDTGPEAAGGHSGPPADEADPPGQRAPAQSTLVIWGARDPILPLPVGQAAVQELGPHTEMITVPEAGHFVVEEAPQTVLPAVRGFLDTSDA